MQHIIVPIQVIHMCVLAEVKRWADQHVFGCCELLCGFQYEIKLFALNCLLEHHEYKQKMYIYVSYIYIYIYIYIYKKLPSVFSMCLAIRLPSSADPPQVRRGPRAANLLVFQYQMNLFAFGA